MSKIRFIIHRSGLKNVQTRQVKTTKMPISWGWAFINENTVTPQT